MGSNAQDDKLGRKKIYKMNYYVDVPITVGMFGLNFYGLHLISKKPNLGVEQINSLSKNDIWL